MEEVAGPSLAFLLGGGHIFLQVFLPELIRGDPRGLPLLGNFGWHISALLGTEVLDLISIEHEQRKARAYLNTCIRANTGASDNNNFCRICHRVRNLSQCGLIIWCDRSGFRRADSVYGVKVFVEANKAEREAESAGILSPTDIEVRIGRR
jgi:hypothetical protein